MQLNARVGPAASPAGRHAGALHGAVDLPREIRRFMSRSQDPHQGGARLQPGGEPDDVGSLILRHQDLRLAVGLDRGRRVAGGG